MSVFTFKYTFRVDEIFLYKMFNDPAYTLRILQIWIKNYFDCLSSSDTFILECCKYKLWRPYILSRIIYLYLKKESTYLTHLFWWGYFNLFVFFLYFLYYVFVVSFQCYCRNFVSGVDWEANSVEEDGRPHWLNSLMQSNMIKKENIIMFILMSR